MGTTPFGAGIGTDSTLRIQPQNWTPPDGAYVMCLGSDRIGQVNRLAVGDFLEFGQTGDFDTTTIFRVVSRTRGPATMPGDTYWEASIRIDGVAHATRRIEAGRTRDLVDMAANVSNLTAGDHALAFRLELKGSAGVHNEVELPAWYIDSLTFDGGDTFTPFGIGDLASWWEADFTTITTTGPDINTITPTGSIGDDFSTTGTEEPDLTTLLAADAVLFDGVNDRLESDAAAVQWSFLHDGSGMTASLAVHPTAAAAETIFASFDGSTTADIGLAFQRSATGEISLKVGNGSGTALLVDATSATAEITYSAELLGPFVVGETLTFVGSGETGVIAGLTDAGSTGTIIMREMSGTPLVSDTLLGGTSAATADVDTVTENVALPISTTSVITLRMLDGATDEFEIRIDGLVLLKGAFTGTVSPSASTGALSIGDLPGGGDAFTGYVNAWTAYTARKLDSEIEALESYLTRWP